MPHHTVSLIYCMMHIEYLLDQQRGEEKIEKKGLVNKKFRGKNVEIYLRTNLGFFSPIVRFI